MQRRLFWCSFRTVARNCYFSKFSSLLLVSDSKYMYIWLMETCDTYVYLQRFLAEQMKGANGSRDSPLTSKPRLIRKMAICTFGDVL